MKFRFLITILVLFILLFTTQLHSDELVFESISDQLVKNINEKNTEKEITFEDEAIFVILVFVTLLLVTLGIVGSILIAKSFSMALGFRQES